MLPGLLLYCLTLVIIVFVHEMGHFLAAKSVGVTVEEVAFGYGRRLVTFLHRGGTDYTLRALPLGGFVRMVGMPPEDVSVPDGLMNKPAWARAWVFLAGPLMNVVMAFLLLCSMGMILGVPAVLSRQVLQVVPTSEAARVGLRTRDEILAINGVPIKDGKHLIELIQSKPGQTIQLTVRRDDTVLPPITATPRAVVLPRNGKPVKVGKLGFQPSYIFVRLGFQKSVQRGLNQVKGFFVTLWTGRSVSAVSTTVIATNLGLPAAYLYNIIGQRSLSLAVFSMLPIPVLDGGRLLLLLVEVLRRRSPEAHRYPTGMRLVFLGMWFPLFFCLSLASRKTDGRVRAQQ